MSRVFYISVVSCSLVIAACGGSGSGDVSQLGPDGGGGDGGGGSAECLQGLPRLTPGSPVTVNSSSGGGNPTRDYCLEMPFGSSEIRINVEGGECDVTDCIGDDLELYLKKGDLPDPFDPDEQTTEWTYTPDPFGYGMYVKPGAPGIWYLSLIDGQNTLGYSGIEMAVEYR